MEKKFKLNKQETYENFAKNIKKLKIKSLKKINDLLIENKKIIGYGAPAKATTVLNYFGINNTHFKYTIDDTELKHDKFIPGTSVQIKKIDDIKPEEYDSVFVLAWNFFDEIKKNNSNKFKNSFFLKLK